MERRLSGLYFMQDKFSVNRTSSAKLNSENTVQVSDTTMLNAYSSAGIKKSIAVLVPFVGNYAETSIHILRKVTPK